MYLLLFILFSNESNDKRKDEKEMKNITYYGYVSAF
jgi:hypothetical protein